MGTPCCDNGKPRGIPPGVRPNSTLISFEILPPLKGKSINALWEHLDPLVEFKPAFVNVTYHRSESMFKKKQDGSFDKIEVRKRPGTVCAAYPLLPD